MMKLLVASAILAAAWQSAAADGARTALIHEKCGAEEVKFKSAVWAFDSKNKVSKKQSESDATFQIEDFVTSAADRYVVETTPQ